MENPNDTNQVNLFELIDEHNQFNTSREVHAPGEVFFESIEAPAAHEEQGNDSEDESNISSGAKIKVVAALAIVGIATYIGYWVQEPVDLRADITSPETSAQMMAAVDPSLQKSVDVSLYGFEPANLQVQKGSVVTWTNTSSELQTISGMETSGTNGKTFSSPALDSGDTFQYTFDADGTFEYSSSYNPALKAKVLVGGGVNASSVLNSVVEATKSSAPDVAISAASSDIFSDMSNSTTAASTSINTSETETGTMMIATENSTASNTSSTDVALVSSVRTIEENLHGAANSENKLASSGPEDILYIGLMLAILVLNYKKILRA